MSLLAAYGHHQNSAVDVLSDALNFQEMKMKKEPLLLIVGGVALAFFVALTVNPAFFHTVYKSGWQTLRKWQALWASSDFGNPLPVTPLALRLSPLDGAPLVFIPTGEFELGTNEAAYAKSQPAHRVYVDAFWMDQMEVSNAQYARCALAGACTPPLNGDYPNRYLDSTYANHPITYVVWSQAIAYCAWAGRRLPTEAEWERAARGEDGRLYPWGDTPPDIFRLNYNDNIGDTTPVDRYPFGASPYGVLNMAGNVREWVSDWFNQGYYLHSPYENPGGAQNAENKVLRGSSFTDDAYQSVAFNRYEHYPMSPGENRGFRCVEEDTK